LDSVKNTDKLSVLLTQYITKNIEKRNRESEGFNNEAHIECQIKMLLARNLYDDSKAAKIWLNMDPAYKKAVEIIRNEGLFKKMKIGNS
jgi:hypothetical protein